MEHNIAYQEDFDKFGDNMAFGESGYSQQAEFVKIKDLDNTFIHVPYTDPKQTLVKLLSNYRDITSCTKRILNKPVYLKNASKKRIYASQDYLIESLLPDFHNGELQITLDDPSTMPEMLPESEAQACIMIKGKQYDSHVDQGTIKILMARNPFCLTIKNQKGEKLELQNCDAQFTIQMVKQRIKDIKKIYRDQQILIFSGKQLQNSRRLKDYSIRQGSIVFLVKTFVVQPLKDDIYTINIKNIKGISLKLRASPYDYVKSLKEQIQHIEKIPINNQNLIYGGTKLSDNSTLFQQKLQNEAIVYLVLQSKGGCFRANCLVQLKNEQNVQISRLKKGDAIKSYNCEAEVSQEDTIIDTYSTLVTSVMRMTMQNGQQIVCTPNHLFLSENGYWMNAQYDQLHQRLKKGSILKTLKGNLKVIQTELFELEQPDVFYHVSVQKNHTFFVNGLICHNMQIFMMHKTKIFTVNVVPSQKISSFKKNILDKNIVKQMEFADMELVYAGTALKNNKTWRDLNIPKDSYIELVSKGEEKSVNKEDIRNKTVVFRFSDTQSVELEGQKKQNAYLEGQKYKNSQKVLQ